MLIARRGYLDVGALPILRQLAKREYRLSQQAGGECHLPVEPAVGIAIAGFDMVGRFAQDQIIIGV